MPSFHNALFSVKKPEKKRQRKKGKQDAVTSSYNFKVNMISRMKMGIFMWIKICSLLKLQPWFTFSLNFGPVAFLILILLTAENVESFLHTKYCVARAACSKSALCTLPCAAGALGRSLPGDPNQPFQRYQVLSVPMLKATR